MVFIIISRRYLIATIFVTLKLLNIIAIDFAFC